MLDPFFSKRVISMNCFDLWPAQHVLTVPQPYACNFILKEQFLLLGGDIFAGNSCFEKF